MSAAAGDITAPAATDRRPVTAVLIANAVSLTGDALAAVAIPWFVLETTGSAAKAGLSGGVAVLPAFVAGIFGGTLIDRLGPKRASVVADVVGGLAVLLIPLLYATVGLAFWQLLVLILLGGVLDLPGVTARRGMLPELARLGGVRLEQVNALLEGNQQLSYLLGPPIAGIAIGLVGADRVLWADAATFALSAAVIAKLVPPRLYPAHRREAGTGYLDELRVGLRFLWDDRILRAGSLALAATNAVGGPVFSVVAIVYARDRFASATYAGLFLSALGLGSWLGTMAYGASLHRFSRRWIWAVAYLCYPLEIWMFAFRWPVAAMLGVLFLAGLIGGAVNPLFVTVRMERIPPALRGRVFATSSAIAMAAQPAGIAVGGVMVQALGLRPTVVVLAVAAQAIGLIIFLQPVWKGLDDTRPDLATAEEQHQA